MNMEYNNKRPLVYSLIVVLLLITGITVAWLTWRSGNTNIGIMSDCFTINYSKGQDISGASLKLLNENNIISNNNITITEGMAVTTASIGIKSTCNIEGAGTLKLNVDSLSPSFTTGNSVGALKYAVVSYNPSTYPNVTVTNLNNASFAILSIGAIDHVGTIDILVEQLSNTVVNNYIIIIYIDGSRAGNDIIGSSFSGTVSAEANQGRYLTDLISNMYSNASKTTVSDTADGIPYNYAREVSLMNDRLGSTGVGIDSGNIRYYGSNPNNYIDIGNVNENGIGNWVDPMLQFGLPEAYIPTTEDSCKAFMTCENLVSMGFPQLPDMDTCIENLPSLFESLGYSGVDEFCGATPAGSIRYLYRIIGLFKDVRLSDGTTKDLVKVIRDDSIGNYSWDFKILNPDAENPSFFASNEWSQADVMKLLNPGFGNNTGGICRVDSGTADLVCEENPGLVNNSLWWNSGSGNCQAFKYTLTISTFSVTVTCNFASTGLSDNVHDKIAEVVWNLGGHNNTGVFASAMYGYERGENVFQNPNDGVTRTTTWPGKVALMYPSDYGYAADLSQCKQTLGNYGDDTCKLNNWMLNSDYQWLLTPTSALTDPDDNRDYKDNAYFVTNTGHLYIEDLDYTTALALGIRPTFYLDADSFIVSGNGTELTPYVVR